MENTLESPHVLELLKFTIAHNRHREAMAKATGEHFNIFRILRVGHREVTTHSPILGELLNPKGKHGQGAVFLRLFLNQFVDIQDFDAESATTKLEDWCGQVTEESGGRIDIVVKDRNGKTVLIENKIYAGDQPNQMQRYREEYPNAVMFYLTLESKNPDGLLDADVKRINFSCISYKNEILAWLNKCREAAACLPNVRETITQYIHLIQELTHQTNSILMSKELINIIVEKPESLRAYYTLRDLESAVQNELITKLDAKLNELAKDTGLKREGQLKDLHKPEAGFYFVTDGLKNRNLKIGFEFAQKNYSDFYFGFAKIDRKQPCPIKADLFSAFEKKFTKAIQTENWPALTSWEVPCQDWRQEAFEAIQSGQFEEDLKAKLVKLAQIAREVCPDEPVGQIK